MSLCPRGDTNTDTHRQPASLNTYNTGNERICFKNKKVIFKFTADPLCHFGCGAVCYSVSHCLWSRLQSSAWACGVPPSGVLKHRLLPDLGRDRRCQGSGTLPAHTALTSPYGCAQREASHTDTAPSDGRNPLRIAIMLKKAGGKSWCSEMCSMFFTGSAGSLCQFLPFVLCCFIVESCAEDSL